ncbi:MAG TPA: DNA methyltransferase [Rhizomicrobium sp.]|nr:DNA methyltransferase [Rhizomicrobium sp.]
MLSTNEVRARAAEFAREWKDARYEAGEKQTFYDEFFRVFGMKRRQVATFEEPVRKLGGKQGFIDLLWKGTLLVEHKSTGRDLVRAKEQALDYFPWLKPEELPRYVLVSDFQNFELYDLDERTELKFPLSDFPQHVEAFNFILGKKKVEFRDQDPVNIIAAELVGKLHDALEAAGYKGHDLERFLVRIVFCLFADDTGIFEPADILLDFLENRTREDGSDLGPLLSQLFDVLNTPEGERQRNLDEELVKFPYVNGDLFAERLRPPAFDGKMREQLLEACRFKWDAISPAIFGALFQSVMDAKERRRRGAHYTTELNILKLIRPLFLDALHAEFEDIKQRKGTDRKNKLAAFHDKLANLTFFDPACGCGNFLIITYRELRRLEIALLKEMYPSGQQVLDVTRLSKLDVNQFYGIEIEEFPARIAETAMWMMDHIMNNELSLAFGQNYARIPLKKSANIAAGQDALEMDWAKFLPPEKCSYVFGNPPFGGAKVQSDQQRAQVRAIAKLGGSGGTLDYVTAWFLKAGAYVQPQACSARIAFVATNSITQGEQVAQLWPLLFSRYGLEISFAHRTFAWGSDARGKAHVHVVIVGLTKRAYEPPEKRLFSYDDINGDPHESRHRVLSPYLFDASNLRDRHLVVEERREPLSDVPKAIIGSKPIDGGYLILDDEEERDALLKVNSAAAKFIRPFIGSVDYIQGGGRWILSLQEATPEQIRSMPAVVERLRCVREYRNGKRPAKNRNDDDIRAPGISATALAETPASFHVTVIPDSNFLVVPEVSSERREYVPIGWLNPPTIPSNLVRIIPNATEWHFGILTSRMHMAWLRNIGGRLKSDYRYSIGIVYNTFPWPEASEAQKQKIRELAQAVLDARAKFPNATLADLYDPDAMPPELRKAHQKLDAAVDSLYRRTGVQSDRERVEHLFMLYEKLADPLLARAGKAKRRRAIPAS